MTRKEKFYDILSYLITSLMFSCLVVYYTYTNEMFYALIYLFASATMLGIARITILLHKIREEIKEIKEKNNG